MGIIWRFLKRLWNLIWNHKRIAAGILVILVLAFIFYPRPKPKVPTQKIYAQTFTQSVSVSGSVNAKNMVNLTFPISGPLSWVGVKKGDSVTQYQTIATLDERTAQKNLQQTLIAYSLQRNTFDQNIANNNGIGDPNAALNDAMKRILQNNQYNLNSAVNSVELQDLARQQSILSTPIAGIVTRADATSNGPTALAGQTTWTVIDPTSIVFDMDVDQADIGKIQKGQSVHIVFDAYANKTIDEAVTSIDFVSHTTSNGGNAFSVETALPQNTDYMYRIGMNANADIITQEKENVLTIPLSSVTDDGNVWVKKDNGFVKRKVKLGDENDTDAIVISGLKSGDEVALDPTQASQQAVK